VIDERINYVEGLTIDDVWRQAMWLCVKKGDDLVVKKGSYEGEIRKQFSNVMIRVLEPGHQPLAPLMPEGCSIPPPTTDEKIKSYFCEYLMNPKLEPNEQYRYSTWIVPQLDKVIEMLKKYGEGPNQACISIGDKDSIYLSDPPCLRVMDFKIVKGHLNLSVYFRSWDLFAGFPENLGGFQLLKEYVLYQIDRPKVKDGELFAYSAGLHLYEHFFELADMLNVDKIKIDNKVLVEKEKFKK
jgi:thymidylate synthase